jgi:transcriptional regulator with XRE-family HTH domain
MNNIARFIKQRLQESGITQQDVADEAKVHRTMVNHVLNQRAKSRKVIAAAERLLGRQHV